MSIFREYTKIALNDDLETQLGELTKYGLTAHRDASCDDKVDLKLHGHFGVIAPSADASLALTAIEGKHNVRPFFTLSVVGGELHVFPTTDELNVTSFEGDLLNWNSADLSIMDEGSTLSFAYEDRLLRIIPEWETSMPTVEFLDDIISFNSGQLHISITTDIFRDELPSNMRIEGDDLVLELSAGDVQKLLRSAEMSAQ